MRVVVMMMLLTRPRLGHATRSTHPRNPDLGTRLPRATMTTRMARMMAMTLARRREPPSLSLTHGTRLRIVTRMTTPLVVLGLSKEARLTRVAAVLAPARQALPPMRMMAAPPTVSTRPCCPTWTSALRAAALPHHVPACACVLMCVFCHRFASIVEALRVLIADVGSASALYREAHLNNRAAETVQAVLHKQVDAAFASVRGDIVARITDTLPRVLAASAVAGAGAAAGAQYRDLADRLGADLATLTKKAIQEVQPLLSAGMRSLPDMALPFAQLLRGQVHLLVVWMANALECHGQPDHPARYHTLPSPVACPHLALLT